MADSNATTATTNAIIGAALRGRIEAIGVFDLLRIAVANDSTGRLLVFNDQFDAELYYADGRLVAATANAAKGSAALKSVLAMSAGEFEFAQGLHLPADQHDVTLHDEMMAAIKSYYQKRVRARQDSSATMPAAKERQDTLTSMPAVRPSGLQRAANNSGVVVSPILAVEPSALSTTAAALGLSPPSMTSNPSGLLPGECGRATTDSAGRTTMKSGNVSAQEAALAALASKTAQSLATILGMRDLQGFEIIGTNSRALLCRVAKEGIRLSVSTAEADFDAVWKDLET